MSLLKNILSPFVEFEENEKKKEAVKEDSTATITNSTNNAAPLNENAEHPLITGNPGATQTSAQLPSLNTVTTALPEHTAYFEKLIDDENRKNPLFQGTDYKEFIDSKTDIDNIPDEEVKYKTAFNVLKRTGLTKEKLVSTAQEYHNIIGRDMNAFQSAHAQQYNKQVKQTEQLIQKKAEELQTLSERMNALKKEISDLSQKMNETKNKLTLTKNSFLLAGEHKQHEIQTELEKIKKYF